MNKLTSNHINLDANASVAPLATSKQALASALELPGNPSSPHVLGRRLRTILDEARQNVAKALRCEDKELFFVSGASEGNRWVVNAITYSGEERGKPYKVLSSPFEHPSLRNCLEHEAKRGKIELEYLQLDTEGLNLDKAKFDWADAVVVSAAHNETGYVPDLEAVSKLLDDECILVSDASQAVARLPTIHSRVDVIIGSAHKMGGVVGCGAVAIRNRGRSLSAPWRGGGQEAGLRPGTEATPLIAAMGEAAKQIDASRKRNESMFTLREEIEKDLLKEWPFSFVVASGLKRLPQTIAICLNGIDGEALRIAIDQVGVCVGFGSACSALAPEPSPSLLAFGLTPEQARATIRISFSGEDAPETIRLGIQWLKQSVSMLV